MENLQLILIIALIVGMAVLAILGIFLSRAIGGLQASFAKLAYLTREDTKRYFDDAATKAVTLAGDTFTKTQSQLEQVFQTSLQRASEEIHIVVERAEQSAAQTVGKAKEEAEIIRKQAQQDAERIRQTALDQSVAALEWAMSEWSGTHLSLQDQSELIEKLITDYLHERKS
ncbi:MAG: hypothetical protein K0S20_392 [Patescibacteria group bacterium]|jgi:F0F1-type ATP synthase membrane subunit b/b'|nr:hypothetical protein [Patescibacteria group bacterium]